jgi:hypothetical protein
MESYGAVCTYSGGACDAEHDWQLFQDTAECIDGAWQLSRVDAGICNPPFYPDAGIDSDGGGSE